MEISLLETGVAPCDPGLRHPKESGLWLRVLPMATAGLRLGWGLLVAPGPCSALPAYLSSSLKPAWKCHCHLPLAKGW